MVVVGMSLSNAWVYLEVYLLLPLVLIIVLTHREYEGEWVWDTVEPSGGVVGLIQRNTDEGRRPLEKPQ